MLDELIQVYIRLAIYYMLPMIGEKDLIVHNYGHINFSMGTNQALYTKPIVWFGEHLMLE